jgi:threonine dehydrogenase-like Zn-dependent dehydrogenase
VEDVATPTILNETDAIVRITTAGICGSDLHVYRSVMGGGPVPYTLGHEAIGYISEIGRRGCQAGVITFNPDVTLHEPNCSLNRDWYGRR